MTTFAEETAQQHNRMAGKQLERSLILKRLKGLNISGVGNLSRMRIRSEDAQARIEPDGDKSDARHPLRLLFRYALRRR